MVAVPDDDDFGDVVAWQDDDTELEAFVHEHHPHLDDDDCFEIVESVGQA